MILSKRQFTGILYLTLLSFQIGCIGPSLSLRNIEPLTSVPKIRLVKTGTNTNQFAFEAELAKDATNQLIRFRGSNAEDWEKVFYVQAEASEILDWKALPPVQGSYQLKGKKLLFEPLFPLQYDINYHATLNVLRGEPLTGLERIQKSKIIEETFRLNKPNLNPSTVVTHVYPSTNSLPENLLKFYVHFSAPMSQGNVYTHIHLYDSKDRKIPLPFLELGEELWNPSETRITILFDPGRIKKGLLPRENEGPVLIQGKSYKLIIQSDWLDASGTPLKESFTKTFSVTAPDNQIPSPNHWTVNAPKAGTKNPLMVDFSEPLDHALISRLIWIETSAQKSIEGSIVIKNAEKHWIFTPKEPWEPSDHKIVIETKIEDLAGNTVTRPFEVDRLEGPKEKTNEEFLRINFTIK